ncbi:TetR/AcrR family transcriptional regulator [Cryobacterium sp. PH31-L1]|uniref:TetR/AcrR family transcriptional regulator n=1 Tax=Cryobacterium sp. PH31-L1 TaxID=3046199 RepID=UPI0024B9AB06|nr:TetR/AcrR family transcriptional regulator [Cryobacterium sp. PH31-L1]MDJ0376129.1 TetR/AcrR family transcriptional regulator [Cryobacterium sp. PH31-L1]
MPKVTEQYRETRRDEIAQAALRCFAKKGFTGASMADIIAESGLSAGAIYGHFESKQQIMLSVASLVIGDAVTELETLNAGGVVPTPSTVVMTILAGVTSDVSHNQILLQVWGEAMVDPKIRELVSDVLTQIRPIYLRFLTAWAEEHEGLSKHDATTWASRLVPVTMGLAHGYIVQSALFPDFDRPAYLASIRELLPG